MKNSDKEKLAADIKARKGGKVKITDLFSAKLRSKCRTQITKRRTP